MDDREFNFWKLLEVIARRIKFIIIFVLIITIISAGISLLLPKWYQASTLVLPPKDEGLKLGWGGSIEEMISLTSGLSQPIMATPTDIYARILGSRALLDRVSRKNNLAEYYDIQSREDLFAEIDRQSEFRVTPEGLLEMKFMDKNAEMAAAVVNSFAEELDAISSPNPLVRFPDHFDPRRLARLQIRRRFACVQNPQRPRPGDLSTRPPHHRRAVWAGEAFDSRPKARRSSTKGH